jgi:hypothetical protein
MPLATEPAICEAKASRLSGAGAECAGDGVGDEGAPEMSSTDPNQDEIYPGKTPTSENLPLLSPPAARSSRMPNAGVASFRVRFGMGSRRAEGSRTYQVASASIFTAAERSLAQLRSVKTVRSNPADGTLRAKVRASRQSWGENLNVWIQPTPTDSAAVTATASLKFGLYDWGKCTADVIEFFAALESELGMAD